MLRKSGKKVGDSEVSVINDAAKKLIDRECQIMELAEPSCKATVAGAGRPRRYPVQEDDRETGLTAKSPAKRRNRMPGVSLNILYKALGSQFGVV